MNYNTYQQSVHRSVAIFVGWSVRRPFASRPYLHAERFAVESFVLKLIYLADQRTPRSRVGVSWDERGLDLIPDSGVMT